MALYKRSFPWRWRRRRQSEDTATDQAVTAVPLIEAGQRLRQHREQRGLSLRDLSREVRITTPVLEALERGWADRLPEPAYLVAMLHRLEQYFQLEPNSLSGALPEDCFQQRLPQDLRRTRFTLGSIDIFTTWQGSLVYIVVISVSLLALNQQQRQLAIDNTKSFTPVPLNLQQDSDALLQGLRPLAELRSQQTADSVAKLLDNQPLPGVLEVTLKQPSTLTLSSEGGDRSSLKGATGTLTLQLLPPLQLSVQPAPAAGDVRWDGLPQKAQNDQPGIYRLDQTSARNP
ncbi:helix-turn-helix domain-containing protein [Synechococcus sp. BIOS-E4-1]|uniref:helix-turn-helix domain-containing protein n=1 Tax=Synechococcus sp. BIOS-E4-1 TaxID=1400864 RepID=UPI0016454CD9|nr:helix-turn-helix transcriptional regulator [Synechococcus sp. BIOS-E4-1]QNI55390.1 helix-turn-helix domain-containing protein [Synechococcus sp. BIOS-E4-1]